MDAHECITHSHGSTITCISWRLPHIPSHRRHVGIPHGVIMANTNQGGRQGGQNKGQQGMGRDQSGQRQQGMGKDQGDSQRQAGSGSQDVGQSGRSRSDDQGDQGNRGGNR
jgi:hypothetical protein